MNRVLITGAHGLLGQKLAICFGRETNVEILLTDLTPKTFFTVPRFDYQQLDVTTRSDVKSLVMAFHPDVIIHTAAMTNVDLCETDRELAWRINVDGLKNLLIPARRIDDCYIIHLSTDYVFDGNAHSYDENARANPLSYYGKTKLASENALMLSSVNHCVVRSQILYGTGINVRQNFVAWILSMLAKKKLFNVVDDQIGNPTFVDDLAYAILKLAEQSKQGVYHIAGSESIDRFHFAKKIAQVFEQDQTIIRPIKSSEIHQQAHRPLNSTFVTLKFQSEFGFRLSDVSQGLQRLRDQYQQGAEFLEHIIEKKAEEEEGKK